MYRTLMASLPLEEIATRFDENERILRTFYESGDSEATLSYKFARIHSSIRVEDSSEKTGSGIFLKVCATPGDLLIVDNAVIPCRAYSSDVLPCPSLPSIVKEDLTTRLRYSLAHPDGPDRKPVTSPELFAEDCMSIIASSPEGLLGASSSSSHGRPDELSRLLKDIVGDIVANNAICTRVRRFTEDELRQVEKLEWWGLWFLVSHIKHSCAPNCHRRRVGQAMFIRAATDIAAGEELTVPYFDIFAPLAVRDANCQKFGFRCECCRCQFERSLGTPYNDTQMQMEELKMQLKTEWRVNAIADVNTLLKRLAELTSGMSDCIGLSIELDKEPDTVGTSHATKRRKKGGISKKDKRGKGWIEASFIHAAMASLCLCGITPLNSSNKAEIAQVLNSTTHAAAKVLSIIAEVHRGSLLGQHIISIVIKFCNEILNCDSPLDFGPARLYISNFRFRHTSSFASYYGCRVELAESCQSIVLKELLKISILD